MRCNGQVQCEVCHRCHDPAALYCPDCGTSLGEDIGSIDPEAQEVPAEVTSVERHGKGRTAELHVQVPGVWINMPARGCQVVVRRI